MNGKAVKIILVGVILKYYEYEVLYCAKHDFSQSNYSQKYVL